MFEQISTAEILKWVALVFLAGFIGFFGKFLGKVVISLFQRKREDTPHTPPVPGRAVKHGSVETGARTGHGVVPEGEVSRGEQKLIKKALKNEAKEKKKSGKE